MADQAVEYDWYRTSDMALVTFLRMNSHAVQQSYWDEDSESVYWEFMLTASLQDLVARFQDGGALVEPKEFDRHYKRTKREMYNQSDARRQ